MPTIRVTASNRRLQASLASFEREYPRAVIESVLRPWGLDVRKSAMGTRTFKNRTGALRRGMRSTINRRKLSVFFDSDARSKQGFPYWLSLEYGSRQGHRARHFFRDAVRRNRRNLERRLIAATRETGRRSGF